jgi:uncharacterized membrane protein HdeD (DUF308 family)
MLDTGPMLETAPTGELAERATRYWWVVLLSALAWLLTAMIVFRFDYLSVLAVAVLFGCIAIAAGVMELGLAAASAGWWRVLHAVLAGVFTAIGVTAFFTPGGTFVGLAAIFGFYFVFAGAWDLSVALWTRREASTWWVQAIVGVIELGLGIWAAGYWQRSAVLLVAFVAAMSLLRAVTQIVFAFRLYELHRSLAHGAARQPARSSTTSARPATGTGAPAT